MNTRDYNEEASDNSSRLDNYGFDLQIRKSLIKRFDKLVGLEPVKSCLEIGSYDGSMTDLLLKSHNFVHIIEPSSEMATLLRERFGDSISVTQSTIEGVGIDQKFDYIYLIHTLEHLDDPVSSLQKIGSLLSDTGGVLFVAVPNARALSRQIAVQMGLMPLHSSVTKGEELQGHRRTYSMDVLQSDLKKAGLNLVSAGGVLLKTLANYQFDAAIETGIVSQEYIDAIYELSEFYPDFSSSIYLIASKINL